MRFDLYTNKLAARIGMISTVSNPIILSKIKKTSDISRYPMKQ